MEMVYFIFTVRKCPAKYFISKYPSHKYFDQMFNISLGNSLHRMQGNVLCTNLFGFLICVALYLLTVNIVGPFSFRPSTKWQLHSLEFHVGMRSARLENMSHCL